MKNYLNLIYVISFTLFVSFLNGQEVINCLDINNAADPAEPEGFNFTPFQLPSAIQDIVINNNSTHSIQLTGNTIFNNLTVKNNSKLKIISTNPNYNLTIKNIEIDEESRVYIGSEGDIILEGVNSHTNPVTNQAENISVTNSSRLTMVTWGNVLIGTKDNTARVGVQSNSSFRIYSCENILIHAWKFYTGRCWGNTASCDGNEPPDLNGTDESELKLIAASDIFYLGTEFHRRNKSMSVSAARIHDSGMGSGSSTKIKLYPHPDGNRPEVHVMSYGKVMNLEDFSSGAASIFDGDIFQGLQMTFNSVLSSFASANENACPDICNLTSVAWNYRVPADNLYPSGLPLLDPNDETAIAYTRSFLNEDKIATVYPNPTTAGSTINLNIQNLGFEQKETDVVIQIFDISGKIVDQYDFKKVDKDSVLEFDLPKQINQGMYLVSIVADGNNYLSRLAVQ